MGIFVNFCQIAEDYNTVLIEYNEIKTKIYSKSDLQGSFHARPCVELLGKT
jgi:hypothetical protein